MSIYQIGGKWDPFFSGIFFGAEMLSSGIFVKLVGFLLGHIVVTPVRITCISKKVDRLHCQNLPCMDIFVCKCAVLGGYMVTF